jgi:hypothetical protein
MVFQAPVGQDVLDGDPTLVEEVADEQRAVALKRLLLTTEEGHAIVACNVEKALEPMLKERGLGKALVLDPAVLVAGRVGRATAEDTAKEKVVDAMVLERCLEGYAVEVGSDPASRQRAHVGHSCDGVATEQSEESFQRVVGVPDGEDRVLGHLKVRLPAQ